ncbi:MAG TPA: diguanylate cyclase [Candidatus Atribacteria bacterium]|nr:diguanylate cyclase [Candidatus Atribacteria bacterium]
MLKKYSFSSELIILTTLIFIFTVSVFGYLGYRSSTQHFIMQAFDTMQTIVRLTQQSISQTMEERRIELLLLKKMIGENKLEPYLIDYLLQSFDTLLVLNREGIVIKAWPENQESLIGENLSHREYFQKTQESLKPYLSGYIKSILDTNIISYSIPVIENGEFQGAIVGGMALEQGKIRQFVSSTQFLETGRIIILDQNNNILLSTNSENIGKTFPSLPLKNQSPLIQHIQGEDYLMWMEDIPYSSWKVVASIQEGEILSYSQKTLKLAGILGILILAVTLSLLYVLLRKLSWPLSHLAFIAKEYAQGNYSLSPLVGGPQEIVQLSDVLNHMRQAIEKRETLLLLEQTYLKTLLQEMSQAVVVLSLEGKLKFANSQLIKLTGYSEEDLIGKNIDELFPSGEKEKIPHLYKWDSSEDKKVERSYLLSSEGKMIPVLLSASPLIIKEEMLGTLMVITNLREIEEKEEELKQALEEIKTLNQELEERNQELEIALAKLDLKLMEADQEKETAQKIAITDSLTQLFNRGFFEKMFPQEFEAAQSNNRPLSLIVADIDLFKKINDTYGHPAGDKVLQDLGKILISSTREEDLVFRFGGEEFIIILHEEKERAQKVAERIRQRVENFSREGKEGPSKFTISLGVASYPKDAQTPRELLIKADQALYQAKKQGRNQVVSYQNSFTSLSPSHIF